MEPTYTVEPVSDEPGWHIYELQENGEKEFIADCPTRDIAESIARLLQEDFDKSPIYLHKD